MPRTPEDCDRLFEEYVNGGDLDALVALYEPSGVLVQQDRNPAAGHAAISEVLAPMLAAGVKIRMHVIHTARAGEDLAMLYNDWEASGPGPDGRPAAFQGKAIEVVRRQADGTWRFALDDPYGRS
jgi:uncharacterized protein (TIGR02246 family)